VRKNLKRGGRGGGFHSRGEDYNLRSINKDKGGEN
jgi:hypothetical protein